MPQSTSFNFTPVLPPLNFQSVPQITSFPEADAASLLLALSDSVRFFFSVTSFSLPFTL
jgi:hypothetical protein